jgi:hypothetical protein
LFPPLRQARALRLGAWAGQTTWHSRSPAAGDERKVRPHRCVTGEKRGEKTEIPLTSGPWVA